MLAPVRSVSRLWKTYEPRFLSTQWESFDPSQIGFGDLVGFVGKELAVVKIVVRVVAAHVANMICRIHSADFAEVIHGSRLRARYREFSACA